MTTQLQWSNRARTELTPTDGSFHDGNARWCGYVDTARHIAKNPKKFVPQDRAKALNILTAEGMVKLAMQLREECGEELDQ